jgi:hypothetical protein
VIFKVIQRTSGWSTWLRAKRLGVNDFQAPAAAERHRLFLKMIPTNLALVELFAIQRWYRVYLSRELMPMFRKSDMS